MTKFPPLERADFVAKAINPQYLTDEQPLVRDLADQARLPEAAARAAGTRALGLVQSVRAASGSGGALDAFLRQYSLASREGVILMCLAEALLRIPDGETADRLIADKIPTGAWDDHCTTNPAFIKHPNGQYWLYYKSWNTKEYETATGPIRGNRKYGLAIASALEGPYIKHNSNPIIDFSGKGENRQFEDAFVWQEKKSFKLIARDMGFYNHEVGLLMESKDGIHWNEPKIAYYGANKYIQQPPPPPHLKKYGRFERPQILFLKGKPAYLFATSQGGKYMTSTPFIFKII